MWISRFVPRRHIQLCHEFTRGTETTIVPPARFGLAELERRNQNRSRRCLRVILCKTPYKTSDGQQCYSERALMRNELYAVSGIYTSAQRHRIFVECEKHNISPLRFPRTSCLPHHNRRSFWISCTGQKPGIAITMGTGRKTRTFRSLPCTVSSSIIPWRRRFSSTRSPPPSLLYSTAVQTERLTRSCCQQGEFCLVQRERRVQTYSKVKPVGLN